MESEEKFSSSLLHSFSSTLRRQVQVKFNLFDNENPQENKCAIKIKQHLINKTLI